MVLAGFGPGYAPWMPGTVASLATAIPLAFIPANGLGVAVCTAVALIASVLTVVFLHRRWSQLSIDSDDPGWVVMDEVAGQAIAMMGALALVQQVNVPSWIAAAAAFTLFRVFDISKIGPVKWAERLHGATGVLLDDVVAGVLAAGMLVSAAFVL